MKIFIFKIYIGVFTFAINECNFNLGNRNCENQKFINDKQSDYLNLKCFF